MGSETAAKRAVDAATIPEAFRLTSAERAGDVAVRTLDGSVEWTWGELREKVDALADGLYSLGVRKGDSVALMLGNRPEFHLADLAVVMIGATPFSIYMTYAPNQIAFVVSDAQAKVLITEQQFVANVMEARKELPDLERVIVVDADVEGAMGLQEAMQAGDGSFDVDASVAEIGADDVLTLIYTSGTTGPPKGVQLAHRNLLAAVQGIEDLIELPKDARGAPWLPTAHVDERNPHHYIPIVFGLSVTTCPDPRKVLEA